MVRKIQAISQPISPDPALNKHDAREGATRPQHDRRALAVVCLLQLQVRWWSSFLLHLAYQLILSNSTPQNRTPTATHVHVQVWDKCVAFLQPFAPVCRQVHAIAYENAAMDRVVWPDHVRCFSSFYLKWDYLYGLMHV